MQDIKLKLCGNHSYEDILTTVNSRANYIGVVFAESKRKVKLNELQQWLKKCPLRDTQQLVGIFVNSSAADIKTVMNEIPLNIIQAHGNEIPAEILYIKEMTGLPVWKAIHHDQNAVEKMKLYEGIVDGYVVDAKLSGKWGGTGTAFDWSHIPVYLEEARRQKVPCFIAGGINPENISKLLSYEPDCIDISSGIETNGRKDETKIKLIEERLYNYYDNTNTK